MLQDVRVSENILRGTSLVVQWLRIHLPMQGTRVPSLVGELRSHVLQASRALVLQLEKPACPNKDPVQPKKKIFFLKQCGKIWGSASSGLQSMGTIGERMNWEEGKVPLNHWIEDQWYHSHPGRNSVREVEKRNKRSHTVSLIYDPVENDGKGSERSLAHHPQTAKGKDAN